ncbi:uncharacterized protein [Gossypium hirsutum]|uniref:Retrovirus-related Pol polyprotein from transposon TNT 1-94-like beta-barrel domain-containing protein n=1 Tax=Gossypium hirsutum TaxID=3635 RepID=A0A1U8K0K1_GOSHI|nr:uncharacterized protein LOC107911129 [Gossypium hirsutum]
MAFANKIQIHGERLEDVTIIEKIIRSMTAKFNYIVCSIEESNDTELNRQDKEEQVLQVSSNNHSFSSKGGGRGKGKGRGNNTDNEREEEKEVSLLLACQVKEQVKEETNQNLWYLDTGCSNHMCGNKVAFSTLDESYYDSVKFRDNSKVSGMGKGQVIIQAKKESIQTISNILYVPDLKTNLLSLGQLQEKGYEIVIKNGECCIQDNKLGLISQVKMTANRIGLKTLKQKNMVTGLPQITPPSQICEECVVSKQHHNPFPKGKTWRAKKVLELVHSDICGQITLTSNGVETSFLMKINSGHGTQVPLENKYQQALMKKIAKKQVSPNNIMFQ